MVHTMDFKKATDELMTPATREDIAKVLGCSVASVRQARLGENSKARRSPPVGWERALLKLAESEIERLKRLAQKLRAL